MCVLVRAVLVSGGLKTAGGSFDLRLAAEYWDPATESWTLTNPPAYFRELFDMITVTASGQPSVGKRDLQKLGPPLQVCGLA